MRVWVARLRVGEVFQDHREGGRAEAERKKGHWSRGVSGLRHGWVSQEHRAEDIELLTVVQETCKHALSSRRLLPPTSSSATGWS